MNFNTFSALYGATIATSSFSGSGYTGSLVQAAQDLNYTLTIVTGSSLGDPLQVTSSFVGLIIHSFTTSSFNERTSSVAISDATPFQSILVQGTVQGVNASTPVVFSSPISSSHISASGVISASGNIFGDRMIAASYLQAPQINGSTEITGDLTTVHITSSGHISTSKDLLAHDILLVGTVADSPDISLRRAGVTGATLKMGGAVSQNGILELKNASGGQDILLQGGGISHISQSLKIGAPYVYPETNPATLTVDGNISGSGNLNISEITSSGALTVSSNQINFTNLPTSDPGVAGRLYRDGGTVKVSI
jgi:hypothetical protein